MSVARSLGLALLGFVLGSVVGGVVGLLGGLGYTSLSHSSSFEGYSGYIVAFWMLTGILLGAVTGIISGLRRSMR